ncbi:MAG TPA: PadR family transcriptional regulator [Spirochaetia bacterium]|nr:PadR family transcriptional regulator [Spirochaetia bacterium]
MSVRLIILGFLQRKPLYGYELKHLIEHIMGDWTDIAFGSIYFALKKLTQEGFVEKKGTEQQAGRPSRIVYDITDAGRAEFLRLLHEVWKDVEQHNYRFDIGLSFMGALSSAEVRAYLEKRIAHLEETLRYLTAHQEEEFADAHVPKHLAGAVFSHHRMHLAAELAWTKDLALKHTQGAFTEELKKFSGLGPQDENAPP